MQDWGCADGVHWHSSLTDIVPCPERSELIYTFPRMHQCTEPGENAGIIEILCQIQYAVKQGSVWLCDAMKCIDMHLEAIIVPCFTHANQRAMEVRAIYHTCTAHHYSGQR